MLLCLLLNCFDVNELLPFTVSSLDQCSYSDTTVIIFPVVDNTPDTHPKQQLTQVPTKLLRSLCQSVDSHWVHFLSNSVVAQYMFHRKASIDFAAALLIRRIAFKTQRRHCTYSTVAVLWALVWTGLHDCVAGFRPNNPTTSARAACRYNSAVPLLPVSLCLFPSVILSPHYYLACSLRVAHMHINTSEWEVLWSAALCLSLAVGQAGW